jgi:tRNA1Val (adenine37-N6)-methyltransferase
VKPISADTISLRGAGIVNITQPAKGQRFTLDSILLADFCRIKQRDAVLEPGVGSGIISILLAKKFPLIRIYAVEIQPSAAALCRRNIMENNLDGRIFLLERHLAQLKKSLKPSSFDVIIANPPYTRSGTGKQSPLGERLLSRHDHLADLNSWFDLHVFLKNKGRYIMVISADRFAEAITLLRAHKLEPKRVRLVHPHKNKPANLALIEAVKSAGVGLTVLPSLIVHRSEGGYSEEMQEIYAAH